MTSDTQGELAIQGVSPNANLQNVELHTENYWKHGQEEVRGKGNV